MNGFFFSILRASLLDFCCDRLYSLCKTKLTTISSLLLLVKLKNHTADSSALNILFPGSGLLATIHICDWKELFFWSSTPQRTQLLLYTLFILWQPSFWGGISVPVGLLLTMFYTEF